jgi:flagellar basal-body rod modification protein FlgD
MAVNSVSGSRSQPAMVDANSTGFNGLTSNDFMKLLIAQLQNQDPSEPVGNAELLQQLSAMRNLQSNIELSTTLKGLANNQQVSAGATFLGKLVTGLNADRIEVTGVADRVFLQNGNLVLGLGNQQVKVSDVTGVRLSGA